MSKNRILWDRSSFSVFVKSFSCFFTQIPGIDIVDQQWTRPVLGITEIPVQNLHYVKTSVQSDEISQSQRSHWHVSSEFHCLVDVLFGSDSFIQCVNGLIDVWHQESVGDEARNIARCGSLLSHFLSESKF